MLLLNYKNEKNHTAGNVSRRMRSQPWPLSGDLPSHTEMLWGSLLLIQLSFGGSLTLFSTHSFHLTPSLPQLIHHDWPGQDTQLGRVTAPQERGPDGRQRGLRVEQPLCCGRQGTRVHRRRRLGSPSAEQGEKGNSTPDDMEIHGTSRRVSMGRVMGGEKGLCSAGLGRGAWTTHGWPFGCKAL